MRATGEARRQAESERLQVIWKSFGFRVWSFESGREAWCAAWNAVNISWCVKYLAGI